MLRSSNPVLANQTFTSYAYGDRSQMMTISGTVSKTLILLLCAFLAAGWTWIKFFETGNPASISFLMLAGGIGSFALALVTTFKKEWAPVTSVFYALFIGLFLGGISAAIQASFPGVVFQAIGLTFGTLFSMLVVYQSGLVQATERFKLGVFAATGGIALFYFVSLILSFFHIDIPFLHGNSAMSIGFSLFVIAIAALNFVIDFDLIEQGARRGAPKYMEWYGAFALMVTLVWLYVEFLRLLQKMRER